MSQTPSERLIAGRTVQSLMSFLEKDLPSDTLCRALGSIQSEDAARLRTISAGEDLPVAIMNRVVEQCALLKGEPLEDFGRRVGRAAADDAVRGPLRILVRAMTPAGLLRRASAIWSTIHSHGTLEVVSSGPNRAVIRLADYPIEPIMCARVGGWIERLAELSGVSGLIISHSACAARQAAFCEWSLDWH